MRVRATPAHAVPMEHAPRTHIGAKSVDVPDTLYYRRRLARGELQRVDEAPAAEPSRVDSAGYTTGPVSDGGMDPRDRPPTPSTSPTRRKGSKA